MQWQSQLHYFQTRMQLHALRNFFTDENGTLLYFASTLSLSAHYHKTEIQTRDYREEHKKERKVLNYKMFLA